MHFSIFHSPTPPPPPLSFINLYQIRQSDWSNILDLWPPCFITLLKRVIALIVFLHYVICFSMSLRNTNLSRESSTSPGQESSSSEPRINDLLTHWPRWTSIYIPVKNDYGSPATSIVILNERDLNLNTVLQSKYVLIMWVF